MLEKKVADLLNDQINKEFYSAYLYLSMNTYFENRGLEGFAHWYHLQAQEECEHAMKMYRFLLDEQMEVTLLPIAQPKEKFQNDMEVLQKALKHEEYVTQCIHDIYNAAAAANDHRSMQFLDWFVKEQAEEEKNANEIIHKYELYGKNEVSLYLLNQELGQRK
ncbi:MAG: ferritin [Bacteroidales bacterium]|nr:ferritin [Bacteroidales bacterium]